MELSNDFLTRLAGFEGSTTWMYLDAAGNVTAGVGHLVASPQLARTLPFQGGDAFSDWGRVKSATPGKLAGYYYNYSTCRLTTEGTAAILQQDLNGVVGQLSTGLKCFLALPVPAQEALCDMAFNLGTHKLLGTYPGMLHCVEAGNWTGAASHCYRHGIGQLRNDWCAASFRAAEQIR